MVLLGISIVAGALFLAWLFLKSRASAGAAGSTTSGIGSKLGGLISMGNALAHNITSIGEQIAGGAIGITDESVNASANTLSKVVNLGGNVLTRGNQIGSAIATKSGQVIKGSITAPLAAAAPIASGVKAAGTGVYHAGEKVVGAVGGAVSSTYNTISGWF